MQTRKIVKIDEEKCNGCGLCMPSCHEGAIKIIDGKARVDASLCDGIGACLGHCPEGAITIIDEVVEPKQSACGCPSMKVMELKPKEKKSAVCSNIHQESQLKNWPVQIKLVPPLAPYLNNADIIIAADCVPFAYANFHNEILKDKILLVGCPKLDDLELYKRKLTDIVKINEIRSITYARMEVPCCSGLVGVIKEVIDLSGKQIPFSEIIIGINGERR